MALTGTELAVDLNELMFLGKVDLPVLQYTYAVLNNTMAGHTSGTAFTPAPKVGSDPVGRPWNSLYNLLQNILGQTADALGEAGLGILHIEAVYEATDTQARDALKGLWAAGPPQSRSLPHETPLPTPMPTVTYTTA
jgi:hypothetical protein